MVKYNQTIVHTTTLGAELLSAILMDLGIDNVTIEDFADVKAILDNKDKLDWDFIDDSLLEEDEDVRLTFYTSADEDGNQLLETVIARLAELRSDVDKGIYGANVDIGSIKYTTQAVDEDWQNSYKAHFTAFALGDDFIIKPTWEDIDAADKVVIEMDPGMAFGTGTHETTSMCALAMQEWAKDFNNAAMDHQSNFSCLDVGTGSGILAMIAAHIGANQISAVELDVDAYEVAGQNFAANGLADRIELINMDVKNYYESVALSAESEGKVFEPFDMVVCNLTSGLIKLILADIKKVTKKGGVLILSGLLKEEINDIVLAVKDHGFELHYTKEKGDWGLVCASSLSD
ncbi:MAG: 50S ribosomal protein L11 methyltransferase [Clostridiales Family XIII bacterium]|nr:50S ribosomal protein L11 methyltransferase [Clostridiales Family XIII bacterium]